MSAFDSKIIYVCGSSGELFPVPPMHSLGTTVYIICLFACLFVCLFRCTVSSFLVLSFLFVFLLLFFWNIKGDGIEFKRHFLRIKNALSDIIK